MPIKEMDTYEKEEGAYEYYPPHGKVTLAVPRWEVEVEWGPETVRVNVEAADEKKALNKVLMGMAKKLNLQPRVVFSKVQAKKGSYRVRPLDSYKEKQ